MDYEMPPYVCLRVRGMAALKQPAKNGPLLAHCGGPGSGRDCAMVMSRLNFDIDGQHSVISDFDLISIDQRGVNSSADPYENEKRWGTFGPCPFNQSGVAVKPFPTMYCNEIKHTYLSTPKKLMQMLGPADNISADEAFRTYVRPIWDTGNLPFTDMATFNESFVRWYYRLVKLEHSLCMEAERYKLKAPNGRIYNSLLFAGTVDLAHDLNLLRSAIGAPKMSLYGSSYGTSVVSVYASIFPHRTYRLVMDGVVLPTPDVNARADSSARGIEAVWDGLVRDCETSLVRKMSADEVCPAAPSTSSKTMKVLKGANRSEAAALLHIIYLAVFRYQEALGPVAMACIEQFYSRKEVEGCNKTLEMERNLTARKNKSQDANESDHFGIGIQALVMGTDSAGRANEEEFITWWKQTKESDPIGVKWATTWMVAMSTWPAYARPVPPVGDPELQAVIIGNLHDPNTAYENAQHMKKAFPQGYLVTWQGYGHCLKVLKHATALLKAYNASKKSETLPEYTNAVAKYACMSRILSYLDTGKGIQDGHTCLVPEPLSLGKAAAAKTWQNANKDDDDADD